MWGNAGADRHAVADRGADGHSDASGHENRRGARSADLTAAISDDSEASRDADGCVDAGDRTHAYSGADCRGFVLHASATAGRAGALAASHRTGHVSFTGAAPDGNDDIVRGL